MGFIYSHPIMSKNQVEEKEKKIVQDAIKVFMTYGIKSVTMDDVARNMRISKKTLYQYVNDKNDLVAKCLDYDCTETEDRIKEIMKKKLNAIDENLEISKYVVEELRDIHPSIFYDLEKYYPEAWAKMNELRHDFVGEVMQKNMERGIKEGLYRDDINAEIMTRLWVARLNVIFDPHLFPMESFKPVEVYSQMYMHHIRGIASEKGLKYFEQTLKTTKH